MERGERFYYIHRQLNQGRCLPASHFRERLEISRATFNRDIEYMRDRYGAPIVFDRARRGYRYDTDAPAFEMPGLWFNAEELHALLGLHALLDDLADGALADTLDVLRQRLEQLLGDSATPFRELRRRVQIFHTGRRTPRGMAFPTLARALIERRRVHIHYAARTTGQPTEREISPQRLIHYRGNWYCDAWCHLREDLRNFAVDAITHPQLREEPALEVDESELQDSLGSAYGIFSGPIRDWAELSFSPERSRWVMDECWHPQQEGEMGGDGRYRLRVPYAAEHELVMDILRHAGHVEVLAPAQLRDAVRRHARALLDHNP